MGSFLKYKMQALNVNRTCILSNMCKNSNFDSIGHPVTNFSTFTELYCTIT